MLLKSDKITFKCYCLCPYLQFHVSYRSISSHLFYLPISGIMHITIKVNSTYLAFHSMQYENINLLKAEKHYHIANNSTQYKPNNNFIDCIFQHFK